MPNLPNLQPIQRPNWQFAIGHREVILNSPGFPVDVRQGVGGAVVPVHSFKHDVALEGGCRQLRVPVRSAANPFSVTLHMLEMTAKNYNNKKMYKNKKNIKI